MVGLAGPAAIQDGDRSVGMLKLAGLSGRAGVAAVVLAGLAAAFSAAPAAVNGTTGGRRGPAVRPGTVRFLDGVAATSARSAWAVGGTVPPAPVDSPPSYTLILHWNGRAWKRVPAPSPGVGASLFGVAAASARHAWAVGWTDASSQTPAEMVILHWNGTRWRALRSPAPVYEFLTGVAATTAGRAWVVGAPTDATAGSTNAVILGWNGTRWRQAPLPKAAVDNGELNGVAAVSARDAWAVGNTYGGQLLIFHWNGTRWKRVPNPSGTSGGWLGDVAAVTARDAWAVGATASGKPLIVHWNGTAWKRVPVPAGVTHDYCLDGGADALEGVAATSERNAWVVGCTGGRHGAKILILHWNGTTWQRVPSPSPPAAALTSVIATSARNAWAAGSTGRKTLILHWNGKAWKRVPSP
jgi:hypothetical protein